MLTPNSREEMNAFALIKFDKGNNDNNNKNWLIKENIRIMKPI
jgi:hypothetical protein